MLRLPRHLLAAHAVHAALPVQQSTPGSDKSVREGLVVDGSDSG